MRIQLNRLLVAALTVALIGAALPTPADDTSQDPLAAFRGVIAVRVATVAVSVQDGRGHPITGLGPEDFRVLVDGQPVELTNFQAIIDGRPVVESPAAAEPAGAPVAPQPAPNLNLVVYLDLTFTRTASLHLVAPELRRFVAKALHPGDRVMVVAFTGRVRVLQPLTDDLDAVAAALDGLPKHLAMGEIAVDDTQKELEKLVSGASGRLKEDDQNRREVEQDLRALAEERLGQVRRSWRGLRSLIDALAAGVPGRKAILHVSDGIPMSAYWAELNTLNLPHEESGGPVPKVPFELREVIAHANANEVTLYTLDCGGETGPARGGITPAGVRGGSGFALGPQARLSQTMSAMDATDTLRLMAAGTGGLALARATPVTLAVLGHDLDTTYSLGYRPPDSPPGTKHRVEVEVARKGLVVRYRPTTETLVPRDRMAGVALSALMIDPAPNPLELTWQVDGAATTGEAGLELPVTVRLPAKRLALVPDGELWRGRLRVFLVGEDAGHHLTPMREAVLPVTVPAAVLDGEGNPLVTYHGAVPAKPDTVRVAVTAFDEVADVGASVTAPVEIAAPPTPGAGGGR
jgi:VWFA-related protein